MCGCCKMRKWGKKELEQNEFFCSESSIRRKIGTKTEERVFPSIRKNDTSLARPFEICHSQNETENGHLCGHSRSIMHRKTSSILESRRWSSQTFFVARFRIPKERKNNLKSGGNSAHTHSKCETKFGKFERRGMVESLNFAGRLLISTLSISIYASTCCQRRSK